MAALNFTTVFLLRRISLVASIFFLTGPYSVFQVLYNIVFCLIYVSYLTHVKPFISQSDYTTELFTELCFWSFSFVVICFTFFIPAAEDRFFIGWAGIGIVLVNLSYNMVLVVRGMIDEFKKNFKKLSEAICSCAQNSACCKIMDCFGCLSVKAKPQSTNPKEPKNPLEKYAPKRKQKLRTKMHLSSISSESDSSGGESPTNSGDLRENGSTQQARKRARERAVASERRAP